MDFMQRVPFGKTGPMVSRLGLASGYGAPTAGRVQREDQDPSAL